MFSQKLKILKYYNLIYSHNFFKLHIYKLLENFDLLFIFIKNCFRNCTIIIVILPFAFSIAVASYAIAEDLAMALRSGKEWDLREK